MKDVEESTKVLCFILPHFICTWIQNRSIECEEARAHTVVSIRYCNLAATLCHALLYITGCEINRVYKKRLEMLGWGVCYPTISALFWEANFRNLLKQQLFNNNYRSVVICLCTSVSLQFTSMSVQTQRIWLHICRVMKCNYWRNPSSPNMIPVNNFLWKTCCLHFETIFTDECTGVQNASWTLEMAVEALQECNFGLIWVVGGIIERPWVDLVYFMAICAVHFDIPVYREMLARWWCCSKSRVVIKNIGIRPLGFINTHCEFHGNPAISFTETLSCFAKTKCWPEGGARQSVAGMDGLIREHNTRVFFFYINAAEAW